MRILWMSNLWFLMYISKIILSLISYSPLYHQKTNYIKHIYYSYFIYIYIPFQYIYICNNISWNHFIIFMQTLLFSTPSSRLDNILQEKIWIMSFIILALITSLSKSTINKWKSHIYLVLYLNNHTYFLIFPQSDL